jgi:hypothetical protein
MGKADSVSTTIELFCRLNHHLTNDLLVYVGDSSTLSFLQTIRRLVEKQLGPSPFTIDSNCSRILEATISAPTSIQQNYALPDWEAAQFMIDSFFANVRSPTVL